MGYNLKESNNFSIIRSKERLIMNCDEASTIMQIYFYPIMYMSGSILNVLSVIVFYLIVFCKKERDPSQNHIFEILFYKSLNDALLFIFNIFSVFYYCSSCESRYYFVLQIWKIVIDMYFTRVFELVSIYLEIFATFNLLLLLNASFNHYCKIFSYRNFYRIAMIVILVFSIGLYCFRFFEFKIVTSFSNATLKYDSKLTGFEKTISYNVLRLIHTNLRDLIGIIALLILNGLIIKTFQNIIKNKKHIIYNVKNYAIKKLIKSKRRLVKMKIITNILNIFFHLPICFFHLQSDLLFNITCFQDIARTFLKFSYLMGFIFYFIYNKVFRHTFLKYIGVELKDTISKSK